MTGKARLLSLFPAAHWLTRYPRQQLPDDLVAGFVTAALLIPQALAYAILAGLPVEVGLYASILPAVVYALLGTSSTLAVGPMAVTALLVANALSTSNQANYLADALLLAALSGAVLVAMAALRLGMLVNLLGHPVLSGFTSGAAVLIILSQMQNLTGMDVPRADSGVGLLGSIFSHLGTLSSLTTLLGLGSLALLLLMRTPLIRLLERGGIPPRAANLASRVGPLVVIALMSVLVAGLGLDRSGVDVVGSIPAGLPAPDLQFLRLERALELLPSAVMISLISYVSSISIAKVLAYRRREKVDNNQELLALGAANLAASLSGGMPVAGSFGRSAINFSSGARTQLATLATVLLVAGAALFLTPLFYHLPKAALAAIIIVAVASLFDWRSAVRTWRYDRADGAALLLTFAGVVLVNIETGLLAGIAVGIGAFLWRSSRPHVAIVGRVPGTEHYRSIDRYQVQTWPTLMLLRVDRSLFFGNISYVEDTVAAAAASQPALRHLVLICSAVNTVDFTAIQALEQLAANLREAGVILHFTEVKGPVMDRLSESTLPRNLMPGQFFLSTEAAVQALLEAPDRA